MYRRFGRLFAQVEVEDTSFVVKLTAFAECCPFDPQYLREIVTSTLGEKCVFPYQSLTPGVILTGNASQ